MLCWARGATKPDKIRSERIRRMEKLGATSRKVREKRLRWFGDVIREEDYVGKIVMALEVQGTRKRGRPQQRRVDAIGADKRERHTTRNRTEFCGCGLVHYINQTTTYLTGFNRIAIHFPCVGSWMAPEQGSPWLI